jgi:hypothetical protein
MKKKRIKDFWEIFKVYFTNKNTLEEFFNYYARLLRENIWNIWHQSGKPSRLL